MIADIFNVFKDEKGNFGVCTDTKGMLSLYEASFCLVEGESILEEARGVTTKCLEEYVKSNEFDEYDTLPELVSHALELPLHWRMLRLETRWFIDVYERRQDMNPSFLELAILDFNIVQSSHQEDLKQVSMYKKLNLNTTKFERANTIWKSNSKSKFN